MTMGISGWKPSNQPNPQKKESEPKPESIENKATMTHAQVQASRHVVKIDDRSKDPSQHFPFHLDCSCGYHASIPDHGSHEANKTAAEQAAEHHKHFHGARP